MKKPCNNRLSLAKAPHLRQIGKASLVLAAFFLLVSVVLAQGDYDVYCFTVDDGCPRLDVTHTPTPGDYDVYWFTVDDGGSTSSGGPYTLSSTIGQPDAGELGGGSYTLGGGFWCGGAVAAEEHKVYLPTLLKNHTSP